mgnify:CR=1 FL=1
MVIDKIEKYIKIPKINSILESQFLKDLKIENFQKYYNKSETFRLDTLKTPYSPYFKELFFLHSLITLNKRLTILEFGSGWSSLFFAHAIIQNKLNYSSISNNLRMEKKFEIFVLENEKKYLNIAKKRISKIINKKKLKNIKIHWLYSETKIDMYLGRICTSYKNFPKVNPDFIYLDGPDQFKTKGKINNFDINGTDFMPMVCDILKIEFFLQPGTIIVADGRAANVQFLRSYFKRNWLYKYMETIDKHIFYLNAPLLGPANKNLLKFYKN